MPPVLKLAITKAAIMKGNVKQFEQLELIELNWVPRNNPIHNSWKEKS